LPVTKLNVLSLDVYVFVERTEERATLIQALSEEVGQSSVLGQPDRALAAAVLLPANRSDPQALIVAFAVEIEGDDFMLRADLIPAPEEKPPAHIVEAAGMGFTTEWLESRLSPAFSGSAYGFARVAATVVADTLPPAPPAWGDARAVGAEYVWDDRKKPGLRTFRWKHDEGSVYHVWAEFTFRPSEGALWTEARKDFETLLNALL
jgi:hypothetical protein